MSTATMCLHFMSYLCEKKSLSLILPIECLIKEQSLPDIANVSAVDRTCNRPLTRQMFYHQVGCLGYDQVMNWYANDEDDGMFELDKLIINLLCRTFPRPTGIFSLYLLLQNEGVNLYIDYLILFILYPQLTLYKRVPFLLFRQTSKDHFEHSRRKTNQSPIFRFYVNTLMVGLTHSKTSNKMKWRHILSDYQLYT